MPEHSGQFIDVFVPNTNGLLNLPHGLAFGPDGHLYVASAGNDAVLRYDGTNGGFRDAFIMPGIGGLDYPATIFDERTDRPLGEPVEQSGPKFGHDARARAAVVLSPKAGLNRGVESSECRMSNYECRSGFIRHSTFDIRN